MNNKNNNSKKCGNCYWIYPAPCDKDWHNCLLPNKNKKKRQTRTITKMKSRGCPYFKKYKKN